jgi:uncharacterized membrane protein YkoI
MKRTALLMFLLLTGLFLIGLAAPALSDNGRGAGGREHDHDRARDAVSQLGARPLATILPEIEQRYRARMVEVEFEPEDGRLLYEIELITATGRIIEVVVDASTGDIVDDDVSDDDGQHPED